MSLTILLLTFSFLYLLKTSENLFSFLQSKLLSQNIVDKRLFFADDLLITGLFPSHSGSITIVIKITKFAQSTNCVKIK